MQTRWIVGLCALCMSLPLWAQDAPQAGGIEADAAAPAAAAISPFPTPPQGEPVVAVLDLIGTGAAKSVAQALTAVVRTEVEHAEGYKPLPRSAFKAALTRHGDPKLATCNKMECLQKISQLCGASLLVGGRVEPLGEGFMLSLVLIEPGGERVVDKQTAFWRDDPGRMVELARPYVDRLLAGARARSFTGGLEVITAEGASIFVDGVMVGTAPMPHPVAGLTSGVHTLQVDKPGHAPYRRDVVVVRAETTLVSADLDEASTEAQPPAVATIASPTVPAPTPAPAVPVAPVTQVATTAGPRKTIAVLDLRAGEATAAAARALTVVVTAEVAATPGYAAVSRNDLRSLLAHQSDGQMLGCEQLSCMADIAKLAAADLIVAGSIEQVESAHVFSLELIDPVEPRVLERQTATWRDQPERMVELARPYVDRLLAGTQAQTYQGDLEVIAPEGATLTLDGKVVGTAPLATKVTGLSTGVHSLRADKEGYLPFVGDLAVVRNETTLVRVDLVDADSARPWYARWWVWGSVGGGLAVIGGAAAAVTVFAVLSQPDPTTLSLSQ